MPSPPATAPPINSSISPPLPSAASDSALSSLSGGNLQPLPSAADPSGRLGGINADSAQLNPENQLPDVDPQIIEALKSKDRIFVLRLGELMEGLINDQRDRISLMPSTSYQRLLVHRCSQYYKLAPENDPISKGIFVCFTSDSRIPMKRLCELVQLEPTVQPMFKIMRRAQNDRKLHKAYSQAGSVTGDEADLSDVDASEAGSVGGRSNATGGSGKKWLTIEEREAAYNEARTRIFMDFEEKEKEKEKDMSASSSSVSLVSGSASAGGCGTGAAEDVDELSGSPVTESEYAPRDKKGSRHYSHNTPSTLSRPWRSPVPALNSNSRNSRASSPSSFQFATIYDPNQNPAYDPSQQTPYHTQPQYYYPYPPHGPPNPFYNGYSYYPPYNPYQAPHSPPQHPVSDPSATSAGDPYFSPAHGYPQPYGWPQPPYSQHSPAPPPPPMQHPPPQVSTPGHPHFTPPQPQYPPYLHPTAPPPQHHAYTYPLPFYPPHEQYNEPLAPLPPLNMNDNPGTNGMGNTNSIAPPSINRSGIPKISSNVRNVNNRHPSNTNGNGNGKGRGAPPPLNLGRPAWSYGPGVGQGGHTLATSAGSFAGDTVGPRLSSSRRPTGNGGSGISRSSNDEVSSTASSSTTSSSSRRTFTSTTSSQHPLPPRPDWAVGLNPQTRSQIRQDHHLNLHGPSSISSPRGLNGSQPAPFVPLQSPTEFPPLSSAANALPEKRAPAPSGAWGKTSNRLMNRTSGPSLNANSQHLNQRSRLEQDDPDRGPERPPPKSAEPFSPKVLRRSAGDKAPIEEFGKTEIRSLVSQVEAMTVDGAMSETHSLAAASNRAPSMAVAQ